jgi:hypothetical protein
VPNHEIGFFGKKEGNEKEKGFFGCSSATCGKNIANEL